MYNPHAFFEVYVAITMLIGVGLLVKFLPQILSLTEKSHKSYFEIGSLMTPAELNFYNVLKYTVYENHMIFLSAKHPQANP
jgi:hypothetical protein